jgi:sugar phosphate isomerase/epimerase
MKTSITRRKLIRNGVITAMSAPFISLPDEINYPAAPPENNLWKGLKPAAASYTFRKFSVDDTIKAMHRLNLKYISIKDFHLSLNSTTEERKALIQKFKDAGITPVSCGNVTMENDEANIRHAFEYARDCGFYDIVCSPHPDSMPILDKMVKEFDIRIAIHNHGPEDKRFPSPYDVWNAVKPYDERIGLCIDIGHTTRAKVDAAEAIIKCKSRLYDLHFKDITSSEPNGKTCPAGRGVIDLKAVMKALLKINYQHLVSIEYEESGDDPVPEVAETIGYANGLLKGMA